MVQLLKQSRRGNCGQTAVAMLSGKSISEIERVYGHGHTTFLIEHIAACKQLGFNPDPNGFVPYVSGSELPATALIRMAYFRRYRGKKASTGKTKRRGHLVLFSNGIFYDPIGHTYDINTIPQSMMIDCVLRVSSPAGSHSIFAKNPFVPMQAADVVKPGVVGLREKVFAELPEHIQCPKCWTVRHKSAFGVRVMAKDEKGNPTKVIRQSYCKFCR